MKKIITLFILLAINTQVWAQQIEVSGTVSDDAGLPLPGATVLVKGTTNGKTADFDGKYTIHTNIGAKLVFSYVGFISKEITVTASTINVQLAKSNTLEAVTIVAYGGATNSSKVASAIATVDSRSSTRKER